MFNKISNVIDTITKTFKKVKSNVKATIADIKSVFRFDNFEGITSILGIIFQIVVLIGVVVLTGVAGIFIANTLFGFTLAYSIQNIFAVLVGRWFVKSLLINSVNFKLDY